MVSFFLSDFVVGIAAWASSGCDPSSEYRCRVDLDIMWHLPNETPMNCASNRGVFRKLIREALSFGV